MREMWYLSVIFYIMWYFPATDIILQFYCMCLCMCAVCSSAKSLIESGAHNLATLRGQQAPELAPETLLLLPLWPGSV